MPSLASYGTSRPVKGLYLGDAGAGKTGSLTSLVKAGYNLRIYDFDNLLAPLVHYVQREAPDKIGNVAVQTFTDKMKAVNSPVVMNGASAKVMPFVDGTPKAFVDALKQMTHWKTADEDLGDPGTWGPETVVVIDTLTTLSTAAFRYAQAMNPAAKEPQTYYFTAQQLIENMLALLCSEQFNTNVLVLAHIDYDKDATFQITKGFPRSIGSALNTKIGAYFNCVLLAERAGSKRQIRTNNAGLVDLKNPVAFKVADTLPLETGMADFFAAVRQA